MKVVIEDRASIILYNVLKELRLKLGEVKFFMPANVCPIVPATFIKAGVKYEFIDIDNETLNIDLNKVSEEVENSNINCGLLFVRYLGNMTCVESEFKKLKSQNVFIIDDRCPSRPTFNENDVLDYSDVTLFSTGYAKYVELGYGGYAFVNSTKIDYFKNKLDFNDKEHEAITKEFNKCIATKKKFKFDKDNWLGNTEKSYDFESYKNTVLENINKVDLHKKKMNDFYRANLPADIQFKTDYQNWRFNITVKDKDLLLKEIFDSGLFASSHYASISDIFANKKSPNAETLYNHTINLFNDYRFDIEKASVLCKIINKFYN